MKKPGVLFDIFVKTQLGNAQTETLRPGKLLVNLLCQGA